MKTWRLVCRVTNWVFNTPPDFPFRDLINLMSILVESMSGDIEDLSSVCHPAFEEVHHPSDVVLIARVVPNLDFKIGEILPLLWLA